LRCLRHLPSPPQHHPRTCRRGRHSGGGAAAPGARRSGRRRHRARRAAARAPVPTAAHSPVAAPAAARFRAAAISPAECGLARGCPGAAACSFAHAVLLAVVLGCREPEIWNVSIELFKKAGSQILEDISRDLKEEHVKICFPTWKV
jgi:hypothetical protein